MRKLAWLLIVLLSFPATPAIPQSATDGTGGLTAGTAWNEELFVGSDVGARINQAFSQLPIYTDAAGKQWPIGWIRIPFGTYTYATTIVISSPFVSLWADPGTTLFWNGAAQDAMYIAPTQGASGIHYLQPAQSPQIWNINITNLSHATSTQNGMHVRDFGGLQLHTVAINGFNHNSSCTGIGGTTDSAIWLENYAGFQEEDYFENTGGYDNCIGVRFSFTTGHAGGTNSFAYGEWHRVSFGLRDYEIGVSIENGVFVYHNTWDFVTESNRSTAVGMAITGNGTFGGASNQQGGDNFISWRMECVGCSGGGTMLNVGTGGIFRASGQMAGLNNTVHNTIAGTFIMSSTQAPLSSLNYMQWGGDGSWRGYFNNVLGFSQYGNNWRLNGAGAMTNLGWSSNITSASNFLGISPDSAGDPVLCVNQGTTGTCNASMKLAGIQGSSAQQLIESVGTLNTPANGIGVAVEGGQVDALAQNASITTTTLMSEPTTVGGGTVNAQIEAECNVIPYSGSGSVVITLAYTDQHSHAQSISSSATAGNAQQSVSMLATPQFNTPVTYAVALTGALNYDLHCNGKQVSF